MTTRKKVAKKPIASKASPTPKRAQKAAGKKTIWVLRAQGSIRDEVAVYEHKEDLMFELQLNSDDYGSQYLPDLEVLECQIMRTWKPEAEQTIVLT
jgi:hypothetical protein